MNNEYIVNLIHNFIKENIKSYELLRDYENIMYVYIFANELEAHMNDFNIENEEVLIEYIREHLWNSQGMIEFWKEVEDEHIDSIINGLDSIRDKKDKEK